MNTDQYTSTELKEAIRDCESKIDRYRARVTEINSQLADTDPDQVSAEDSESFRRVSELTTEREVNNSAIEKERTRLADLQSQLKEAERQEFRENQLQQAVELAKSAESLKQNVVNEIREVDQEFASRLVGIFDQLTEWQGYCKKFIETLAEVEPTFRARTQGDAEAEERRKLIVDEVERISGVTTNAARSSRFLSPQQFNESVSDGVRLQDSEQFLPVIELCETAKKNSNQNQKQKA